MTKKIEQLKDAAIEAIQSVVSDKSGDYDNNIEALEEIRDECQCFIDALIVDKQRSGKARK